MQNIIARVGITFHESLPICFLVLSFVNCVRFKAPRYKIHFFGWLCISTGLLVQLAFPLYRGEMDMAGNVLTSESSSLWYVGSIISIIGIIFAVFGFTLITYRNWHFRDLRGRNESTDQPVVNRV